MIKKIALALMAAGALSLAQGSIRSAIAQDRLHLAQADVKVMKVKAGGERRSVKKVVVKRGKMERRGATKKVVIKKKRGGTVVKKKIIHRS